MESCCITNACWFSLASLESMELRDNVLKTLPASMSSLTKLRVLDLGSNLLEDLVSLHLSSVSVLSELQDMGLEFIL